MKTKNLKTQHLIKNQENAEMVLMLNTNTAGSHKYITEKIAIITQGNAQITTQYLMPL